MNVLFQISEGAVPKMVYTYILYILSVRYSKISRFSRLVITCVVHKKKKIHEDER